MAAPLVSVADALAAMRSAVGPLAPRRVPLSEALGAVLTEPLRADADSPPHRKAMMDGYAVVGADLVDGEGEFTILEEVTAGLTPTRPVKAGFATRVMTGAPVPDGANAVVMIERAGEIGGAASSRVRLRDPAFRPGQHIMQQGEVWRAGETVLAENVPIGPAQIALAAEAGYDALLVRPIPRVAVLATGNELVPPGTLLTPGKIRNSNGPLMVAMVRQAGCSVVDLGIARDDAAALREAIALGLSSADVLVLSGGVSAGVLDLAPAALAACGVEQVLHRVRIKPGQPLWFGVRRGENEQPVFGLPGNPVSTFVCFQVFVRPLLEQLGAPRTLPKLVSAELTADFRHKGDRPTYFPAVLEPAKSNGGPRQVRTVSWRGSSDLRGLAQANALAVFSAGDRQFSAGEEVEVLPLDRFY
jgi:molybdopterin molybdotransferase